MIKVADLVIMRQIKEEQEYAAVITEIDYQDPNNWTCSVVIESQERRIHIFIPQYTRDGSEIVAYLYPLPRKEAKVQKGHYPTGDYRVKSIVRGDECIYTEAK